MRRASPPRWPPGQGIGPGPSARADALVGTPLKALVTIAGTRWAIEECFQAAKNETGLDHYQVRRHDAWYRHATLSMLALAFLAVTRRKGHHPLWTDDQDSGAA